MTFTGLARYHLPETTPGRKGRRWSNSEHRSRDADKPNDWNREDRTMRTAFGTILILTFMAGPGLVTSAPALDLPADIDYVQCAAPWLNDPMGQPGSCSATICSQGTLVTCVAMLLSWVAQEPGNPDPRGLNDWLRAGGGYVGCNLFWGFVDDYDGNGAGLEWVETVAPGADEWADLDAELDAVDRMPLVAVWSGGHWVVVYDRIGSSGVPSSYLVLDSAAPYSATRTLEDYQSAEGTVFRVAKFSGTFLFGTVSSIAGPGAPGRPSMLRNFPNPFNPCTTVAFDLPEAGIVDLRVYDLTGHLVEVLLSDVIARQGRNEIIWRGTDLTGRIVPSGTYFYRLQAGDYVETKRMTLLK